MAVHPINVNRVTTTLKTDSMLSSLRRNTFELFREQNRLSAGRQFIAPSDDPGRAARALNLSEILDQQSQMVTNIRHAGNTLDATDVAMAEVSSLIIDAQAVASRNIGSLSSAAERSAAAEIIASIRDQLVAVGNRSFDGRFLFAGRKTDAAPFVSALGGIAYVGDTGSIFARTDAGELDPINLSGDLLFGALSSEVLGSADLNPIITETTRIEDLQGALGRGVRLGSLQIVEEGGAGTVTIDLTGADAIGDVVDRINAAAAAAGAGFTASLTTNGLSVTPAGASVSIRDISTGTTAADLGIATAEASSSAVVGADLGALVTMTTRLADLLDGAGIDPDGGFVINNAGQSVQLDLAGAETVQDVVNAINNSGLFVRAEINGDGSGLNVINTVSGSAMSIGENGGTTAADLGIRSLAGGTLVSSLNNGAGLRTAEGVADIRIIAKDGSSFTVDLDGTVRIDDVIAAINTAATDAGVAVTADLTAVGNGIRLTDASGGVGSLSVVRENLSQAADDLGLLKSVADPETVLIGDDVGGARANGLLTAMFDLETALRNDDSPAITAAAESLDAYLVEFNRSRGVIGARAAAMQDRLAQTESAVFATQELLSQVQDLDYTEAVTRFQQAQTALQASLLTGSQVLNLSLLDFIR